jgi:hypothetical protein
MQEIQRQRIDGLLRYDAVVVSGGRRVTSTIYTDWFGDDAEAGVGFRAILETQGYAVREVRVGRLTEVEIATRP